MRPCQHCGTAILPKETICSTCGEGQMSTVAEEETEPTTRTTESDASVVERQVQIQAEGESWLIRTVTLIILSVYACLLYSAFLSGGVWAMGVVTGIMAFAVLLIISGFRTGEIMGVMFGVTIILLLIIASIIGTI